MPMSVLGSLRLTSDLVGPVFSEVTAPVGLRTAALVCVVAPCGALFAVHPQLKTSDG